VIKKGVILLSLLLFALLVFALVQNFQTPPNKETTYLTKENVGESDKELYRFNKSWGICVLGFEITVPANWEVAEGTDTLVWELPGRIFEVSWRDLDIIYDQVDICRTGTCKVVGNVSNKVQGFNIEILKPTPETIELSDLPEGYLQATISGDENCISPEFATSSLSLDSFKEILSTFKFID